MTPHQHRYLRRKDFLLNSAAIGEANRSLFRRFLAYEEYKLQRKNNLSALDEACYKTLYLYLFRLENVNEWFKNKAWVDLTKEDIQKVYDQLEDGIIRTSRGNPYVDRRSYYNKIFRSKPFLMAGKRELVDEVMEFYTDQKKQDVRFLDEDNFLKIVSVLKDPAQLLLCWLAWDIGENINSLLQLQKREFIRQIDRASGEAEYLVTLLAAKLKRSRTPRTEPTMYAQTVRYADMVTAQLKDEDYVFPFKHRQALKFLQYAARRCGALSSPRNEKVIWRDFRSGMACQMLKKGCSLEDVNARLGHRPSSRQIDCYINFLALDRRRPKKTVTQTNLGELEQQLNEIKQREKLARKQLELQSQDNEHLESELARTQREVQELRHAFQEAVERSRL